MLSLDQINWPQTEGSQVCSQANSQKPDENTMINDRLVIHENIA
jgi:hypothetical protein